MALPEFLAGYTKTAGVVALLLGGALFVGYLFLLSLVMERGVANKKWLEVLYGVYLLLVSGYGVFLLGDLVKEFLLPNQSFGLLVVMILLLLLYGSKGGLEGRGRVFELLFWPLLALLVTLLFLGFRGIEPENLFPIQVTARGLALGTYGSFLMCSVGQLMFFMPAYMESGVRVKDMRSGTIRAVTGGVFVVALIYEMLLGSFGGEALAYARTPIMIYTSNIIVPGGFLRRQEALIAGVCFIALLSFIGSGYHYGTLCLKRLINKKWMNIVTLVFLFLVALIQYNQSGETGIVLKVLFFTSPIALLIPFLMGIGGKGKRLLALGMCVVTTLFCTACSVQELEDRSFPMVMALQAKDASCILQYKYMDFSHVSDQKKAKQGGKGLKEESESVSAAIYKMDMENGKVLDLNHLKVLLLEESFLENQEFMEELIKKGNSGVELPGNMLVFATKSVEEITGIEEGLEDDLGSYLEELMEGNPNYKAAGGTTFKHLICDYYNGNGNTVLPRLTVKNDLPIVSGYYILQSERLGKNYKIYSVPEEAGLLANLCDGKADALDLTIDDGRIHMENVDVSYEFSQSNSAILCQVTVKGDIVKSESTIGEKAGAKNQAHDFFVGEIQNVWDEEQLDLTNSYYHLRCHDRDLCEKYQGDYGAYCKDLRLDVRTGFNFVE